MVYLFISQPMSGRSSTEIIIEREELFEKAEKALYPGVVEEVDSYLPDAWEPPLYLLGRSISAMANADYAIFADGWEHSRGCQIERACAEKYGVPILEV